MGFYGTENTEPVREHTIAVADGIHCRFCGETSGELAPGGSEYRAFWEQHEARAHKIEHIRAAVKHRPCDEILAAILDELL